MLISFFIVNCRTLYSSFKKCLCFSQNGLAFFLPAVRNLTDLHGRQEDVWPLSLWHCCLLLYYALREAGSISFYRSCAPNCLCHPVTRETIFSPSFALTELPFFLLNYLDFDSKVIKIMIIEEMAMIIYKDTHIITSWLKSEKKK